MVSIIWCGFIVSGIFFAIFTGKIELINNELLNSPKTSLELVIKIFPIMALWLGIMNIAKDSGLLAKVSKKLSPIFIRIFPEIPKGHESIGFITTNVIANLFGLGNAATPFGLKAMKSLQELNKDKKVASRSMITFLVLNTSGMTIIPTTIISLRMMYESNRPSDIIFPCFLATLSATIGGLIVDRLLSKRRYNDKNNI